MKENTKNKEEKAMTLKQMLKDPSLEPFHELLLFIKDKPNKDIFPKKYEMGMMDATVSTLLQLFEKNPRISLKMALSGVIKTLPNDITDTLLSKVVQKVFDTLPILQAQAQQKQQIRAIAQAQKEDLVAA